MPNRKILQYIYIPSIATHIIAASKITLGVMWKTVIMAELLTVPNGLGAKMGHLRTALETEQIVAITVIIVVINFVCQKILDIIAKKSQRWKNINEFNNIS